MLHIQFDSNIFSPEYFAQEYEGQYSAFVESLKNRFREKRLGFYNLDTTIDTDEIFDFVSSKKGCYENVVVCGIGGSALGTNAVFSAVHGDFYNYRTKKERDGNPRLFVLDNVDPIEVHNLRSILELKNTLCIVISKSGGTLETHAQYHFFKNEFLKEKLKLDNHFVFVTGKNSALHKEAKTLGIHSFFIPENVGGRFSVFTAVGLLPLAFVGVDIKKLLAGQKKMKQDYISTDLQKNLPLFTALIDYESHTFDKNNIMVLFPYVANLKYVSAWFKQLYGESLGKKGIGANMMTSLGATDQHSDLQLYNDGPKDKLFIFLELKKFPKQKISPKSKIEFADLMHTEKYGTAQAITDKKHPNYTLQIDTLDEQHIGALLFFFEMQVAYLGELYQINAYNQPGVEASKIITKQELKRKFGSVDF